jgi:hypothetical protein
MNKLGDSAEAKKPGTISTSFPQKEGAGGGDTPGFNYPSWAIYREQIFSQAARKLKTVWPGMLRMAGRWYCKPPSRQSGSSEC